jgi:superfamily II DNA or RNA helicase
VRIRGQRWRVASERRYPGSSILDVDGCDDCNHGVRTAFLLPCESVEPVPPSRTLAVVGPARWRPRACRVLAQGAFVDELRSIAGADMAILPFQLEPALALIRGVAARVLIADEVGLGKTVQAGLAVAETLGRDGNARVLVIAPAGLCDQWMAELDARFHLGAVRLDSVSVARTGRWSPATGNPWSTCPLVIASIDYVKRPEVMRALEGLVWDLVVFDEAHALSGRSDRRVAATSVAARARSIVMLTATPHSGDDASFARLRGIGDLQDRFPLAVFHRTCADAGVISSRRTTWLRVQPTADEAGMHEALTAYARLVWSQPGESKGAARLAALVLMRRAFSSAGSLRRSIERRLALVASARTPGSQAGLPFPIEGGDGDDDEEPAAELAGPGLDDIDEEVARLRQILEISRRAEASESKFLAIVRLLRRIAEPAIVFTEYRDTLARLVATFEHTATVELHGGLLPSARAEALRAFSTGAARVLVATDTASEGLSLHERCRLVVNLELPWTPLRLEQRIGRVARLGQRRKVHALHLVAAGTGEQHAVASLLARMERVSRSMNRMRAPRMTEHDVARSVLGLDRRDEEAGASGVDVPDPRLVVPDLRVAASAEAMRAVQRRRLADLSASTSDADRPFATMVRARRRERRAFWVFRLEYVDRDERRACEILLALAATPGWLPRGRAAAVRTWFEAAAHALSATVAREQRAALARLRRALETPLALAAERERAIMTEVAARHGRMAASLVQPGLFDRRVERAAAAQVEMREQTLVRCRLRLDALDRAGSLAAGRTDVALAVIVG